MLKYKLTKEEYDALDPTLQAEYKDQNGAYVIDLDENLAQKTIEAERRQRQEWERKAKKYEADFAGVSLDEWSAYADFRSKHGSLTDVEAIITDKSQGGAKWLEERQRLTAEHSRQAAQFKTQIDEKEKAIRDREAEIDNLIVSQVLNDAFSKFGVNSKRAPILRDHLRGKVVGVRDNGKIVVRISDGNGDYQYSDGAGNYKTADQFIEELSKNEDYAVFFDASGVGGSGAPPRSGGQPSRGGNRISFADKTVGDRLEDIAAGKVVMTE